MRPPDMYDAGGSSSSRPHAGEELPLQVVLYTASASRRAVRASADHYALRALLRGYGLTVDEHDVSTSNARHCELKSLLAARGCAFSLPQLLIGGRLVGGPKEVRQLHETDKLRPLLDGAPRQRPFFICETHRRVGSVSCWKCNYSRNKMLDHGHEDGANVIEEDIVFLFDPIKDVSMGGKGREMKASFSVSLGAMRPLLEKLDLMLGPQGCKLTKGVNDRLHLLKYDLKEISGYLEDLIEVEEPPLAARCWMKGAHELSYDILDYIDNLVPLEILGCKFAHRTSYVTIRKRLKWQKDIEYAAPQVSGHGICKTIRVDVIRVPRRLKWSQHMVAMLSEFRMYAQEAVDRYERYLLPCCITSSASRYTPVGHMTPMLPSQKIYPGLVIDGRMSQFINSLANDGDQQLKVVSIHGSGCLGKTMLARVLYNESGKQFRCRAFIRVSKQPNMKRLFCDMLSQIQRKQPQDDCDEPSTTADSIRNHLEGKRYLIIVDDLWDTSAWDVINKLFPMGSQGSRIIVTTQIEDVASECCCHHSEHIFEMKPLDTDHSRKLFFERLNGSESDCPENFKQVSSQIVEICGGLPMAIISIASLLANQPTVVSLDLLTHIHDSLVSCLPSSSTSERMTQVLNLSYNMLPHHLKTCLLHLGMYPEGSIIFKHDLVNQWVGEGFIATREGQDVEQVAGMYFDDLVDRNFIQPMYINYNNEVVSCTVHHVLHDLIALKSAQENFIVVVDCNRKNMALSHKVHRLSLHLGDAKYAKIPSNIRKSQVRSLVFFGLLECMPCIGEFKLLHVLNLHLSGHHRGDQDQAIDLTRISELLHLIYLKITCDVCAKLPSRMRGLQCLETLDVMDTARGTDVPLDIVYLPRLLHLRLPVHTNLLYWYTSFRTLGILNHLHELHISPSNSDHLERSMQVLACLIGGHASLKTIRVVPHGSSVRYGGASKATIDWSGMEPPAHLQRFEFPRHSSILFHEIPSWMERHANLCILKITLKRLSTDGIEILRWLPALTALSLFVETAPCIRINFYNNGFSVLKYFKLRCMTGIAWIKFEVDATPNLRKLKLVFCAIPRMDQRLFLYSQQPELKQYRHGTALISVEHMPGLQEISTKFGGAASDLEYVSRIGIVSNHPKNPTIDVQLVDSGSNGDKRISSGSLDFSSRLHVPGGTGADGEQQDVVSWSNIIAVIGRDLFIHCLLRLPRSDYGSIASLNHDLNSLVRSGDIYRLRQKNGVLEHWLYLCCKSLEWDAYDPSTGRWIQVPKMPPFRYFTVESLAVGTELLVFGMASYSILTNSWTVQANEMNDSRMLFGSASVGKKAYIAGGLGSSDVELSTAEMYDSETHTWSTLPSMNRARMRCSGVFMDGKLYMIGGVAGKQLLTCGEEYDLERQSWRLIDNMSEGLNNGRDGVSPLIAVVNNELYAADCNENVLKQYNKLDNKWITLGKLPVQPVSTMRGYDMGLQACGDRLFVIGPPSNSDADTVELHSWIPDEQPPAWNLVATRPCGNWVMCAVMGC